MRQNRFEPAGQRLVIHPDKGWDTDDVTGDCDAQKVRSDESRTLGRPIDRHLGQCWRDLPREHVEESVCRRLA
jgi:hypothetical protein